MRKPATKKPKVVSLYNSKDTFQLINPNCEPLTIEKVRSFPGYEDISDERASELVDFLSAFSEILFDYMRANVDSGPEISLPEKIAA